MIHFVLVLAVVFFSNVSSSDSLQGHKFTLDNGMVVVIHEIPTSPVIAIYPLVKTGSATEGQYLGSGISHFVEHMLFKGTPKRGMNTIAQEVKVLGGDINASTSFDYTIYTLDLPAGYFKEGLDIVADMLMNSLFDPTETEKERDVILGEVRMINDRPERKFGDLVHRAVFERHPYRHPVIGYVPVFKTITQKDLVDYFKTHYAPNNIVFSVAGPIKAQEILPLIQEAFKDFKSQYYQSRDLPQEPPQIMGQWVEDTYHTQVIRLSMVYQGIPLSHPDLYALDVLAMALGQGESSRLYKDLYEKRRLVDFVSASNFTPMDMGYFEIEMLLPKDDVKQAVEAVRANIRLIQEKGIDAKELVKVKQQVISEHVFGRQTASSVAYRAAVDEAFMDDFQFSNQYIEGIRQVTSDQVKRVAQKYLYDENLNIAVLRPQEDESDQAPSAFEASKNETEKIILSNGLTLLIREDHSFPLVTIQAVSQAGVRQEPVELNGLSEITSRLWLKGTQKYSAQAIAQQVEERGARLNTFAGKNSMGLQLDFLTEHTPWALGLLEDLIKNPAFNAAEFEKAKAHLLTDLKLRDDQIMRVTLLELQQTLFKHHPFRMDSLGTQKSLQKMKREDVVGYYNEFISPSNLVVSIFGDFDRAKVVSEIKQKFQSLPASNVELKKFQEDAPKTLEEKTRFMLKEQAALTIGFQAPTISDSDRYSMEVIEALFGSSLSGRLFIKVREELGQAYALGADYVPSVDTGMVYFYVLTTDQNVERVKEILLKELDSLGQMKITDEELASTKLYLKGRSARDLETVSSIAFKSALDELYGLGFNYYQSYDQRIDAVTQESLIEVAHKYLDPRKAVIVMTRPQPAK